jgi:hypothetical protein
MPIPAGVRTRCAHIRFVFAAEFVLPSSRERLIVCKEYERLEQDCKSEMQQYAQFTFPQNRDLRGTSDRESKRIAKDAMARASMKRKEMSLHRQTCEECKAETKA